MKYPASILAALLVSAAPAAQADVFNDDLTRCLVSHTSANDKIDLARWIFAAISVHPKVADISAARDSVREIADLRFARIVERLLTNDCRAETGRAFQVHGENALNDSFEMLGKIAMQELTQDQRVNDALSSYVKYLDQKALASLINAGSQSK